MPVSTGRLGNIVGPGTCGIFKDLFLASLPFDVWYDSLIIFLVKLPRYAELAAWPRNVHPRWGNLGKMKLQLTWDTV